MLGCVVCTWTFGVNDGDGIFPGNICRAAFISSTQLLMNIIKHIENSLTLWTTAD